jgi:hypothetical protein
MLVFSSPADSQIALTQYPAYAFHMQEPLATATADVWVATIKLAGLATIILAGWVVRQRRLKGGG